MTDATARREALKELFHEARGCERCPQLAATRTQVVFGAGNADADLMLVGEAPGADEDRGGLPFVGRAGRKLDELLAEVGLARADVFVVNVLKCRPPGNRDPLPEEVERCQPWLWRQLELVRPRVVLTLGNYATKLLRGDATGITRIHGQVEERTLGPRRVRLLPVFHPAAALYRPEQVEVLRADLARLPELLALPPLEQPDVTLPEPDPAPLPAPLAPAAQAELAEAAPEAPTAPAPDGADDDEQLGLF